MRGKIFSLAIFFLVACAAPAAALCTPPAWDVATKDSPLISYKRFFSATAQAQTVYGLYLPPAYAAEPTRRFPVVFWLHGGGGQVTTGQDFVTRLDGAIRRGAAPQMIAVLVHGPESMWTDSKPGATLFDMAIEQVLIQELLPLVDSIYRTINTREGRGIEGFSMGGRGSSRLGLKFPNLFSVVSNLAGANQDVNFFKRSKQGEIYNCVYGADDNYFHQTSPQTHALQSVGYIRSTSFRMRTVNGDLDSGNHKVNLEFSQYLTSLGIANTFTTAPGVKHCYQCMYDKLGDAMFTFFSDAWRSYVR